MTTQELTLLRVKGLMAGAWFLFICYSLAVWIGYAPPPQFAVDAWHKFHGNEKDKFMSLVDEMPEAQQRLVTSVLTTRKAYLDADNDLSKGSQRLERRKSICATDNRYTNGEWVGYIDTLSSNSEGLGVIKIKIAPFTTVGTWNNSLSDIGSNTLLRDGDLPFEAAKSLKVGDKVAFSGKFFESDADCIEESSVTLKGSMTQPNFIIKFSSIRPAD